MFPEMEEEGFSVDDYPQSETIQLEQNYDNYESNVPEYIAEIDRPWGTYKVNLLFRKAEAEEDEEGFDLTEVDQKFVTGCLFPTVEPEPISVQKQKELDEEEEKHQKEKEREAKNYQKELEKKKAEEKIKAQMQLLKQEQNSTKLKIYFGVMHLYFHKVESDFNISMSLLSIFHTELHEHFKFYASCFEQYYHPHEENLLIVLQGFIHFAKLMDLAKSADEVTNLFSETLRLIDGIGHVVEDTVHIRNGFNYAQFLEAILRIGYVKAANSEDAPNDFKTALDKIFQNPNLDIKKRVEDDPVLANMYFNKMPKLFKDNEEILCAVYSEKAHIVGDTYPQLHKNDFVSILSDAGLLIIPKVNKVVENLNKKVIGGKQDDQQQSAAAAAANAAPQICFAENEVKKAIEPCRSFDKEYLGYFDFLEALVRVTLERPWTEEENEAPFKSKLQQVISQIEGKFAHCINDFRY